MGPGVVPPPVTSSHVAAGFTLNCQYPSSLQIGNSADPFLTRVGGVQTGCRSDSDDNRSLIHCAVMFESPALNAASILRMPAAANSRKLRS